MNLFFRSPLKLTASVVGLLLSTACGSGSGGGGASTSSCMPSQGLSAAFHTVMARTSTVAGEKHLMLRMNDLAQDFQQFRQDLLNEYKDQASKVSVKKVNATTVSVRLPDGAATSQVVEQYISDQKINYIEQDSKTYSIDNPADGEAVTPTLPAGALQGLDPALRSQAGAGQEIVVAIIDSGVDYTHKDLAPYMWKNPGEIPNNGIDDDKNGFVDDVYGWDFANDDKDPMSDDTRAYHGTHVAGIVKQAAQLAELGIKVKIMALKYLDASSTGRTSNAIRAIDYAIHNGAKILNNSWGAFSSSALLSDAIERARVANVLFVAAAGNGDAAGNGVNIDQTPFYPAGYPHSNIISVAAVDSTNRLADWSNFGSKSVDLAAPGVGIVSTRNGNTYGTLSGTSMAAPYVSGVAAMLWSLRPDLSAGEVRKILFQTARTNSTLSGKVYTNAVVNRTQAVQVVNTYTHNPNETFNTDPIPTESCGL